MNMVNEGVLPPDEMDDRDERREEQERARSRETFAAIERHYNSAKERHPYFCDNLLPRDIEPPELPVEEQIEINLAIARKRIKSGAKLGNLLWNEILNCEVWEATEAIYNRDYTHAVEECYDVIAVLLRTIDVLEGRQRLGKPEEGGEA